MPFAAPPFRLAASALGGTGLPLPAHAQGSDCCGGHAAATDTPPAAPARARLRLAELDTNFLCSVIGTCLSTAALRKAMAHFVVVQGASDLDIHHDAVMMASEAGPVARSLHKVLDLQHAAALQRFARASGVEALAALWAEAQQQGEIPSAYWALLTHRDATPELRKKAFGDVHMLSHLVGAANRADIRRLVALEKDNAELRERMDRHHLRTQELLASREDTIAALQRELAESRRTQVALEVGHLPAAEAEALRQEAEAAASLVALQTARRETAEQAAANAADAAARLREDLVRIRAHAAALAGELDAAEQQLQALSQADTPEAAGRLAEPTALARALQGRRVLYVGGRPSTAPSIRDLVQRHGGTFQRHDGLEDRKGLLPAAVAGADLVVFPVDCVDHDAAGNLKRLCLRQGIGFLPLRSAGLGSFAAALVELEARQQPPRPGGAICLKHG